MVAGHFDPDAAKSRVGGALESYGNFLHPVGPRQETRCKVSDGIGGNQIRIELPEFHRAASLNLYPKFIECLATLCLNTFQSIDD